MFDPDAAVAVALVLVLDSTDGPRRKRKEWSITIVIRFYLS